MKKRLFIVLCAFLPLVAVAQNTWERPQQTVSTDNDQKKKALFEKNKQKTDPKYLAGAVPVVDGKVTFTLDADAPGKSAQQIYDAIYRVLDDMTKEEGQFKESQVALVDKQNHSIAARYKEWLVFQNTLLSLDRTVFNYTVFADCTDGHAHVTITRISYMYEMERGEDDGMMTVAEGWITDDNALNKKGTKLAKYSGKFRRKTIDRKDIIFDNIKKAIQ